MQAQQQPDVTDERNNAPNQSTKVKGVLSKVKHKASKLKDKVKKVAHPGSSGDKEKKRALSNFIPGQGEPVGADSSSSGDDENMNDQLKYKQLDSVGLMNDIQGDGSDVEHHDGIPTTTAAMKGGTYWNRSSSEFPASTPKNSGPQDTLETSPTDSRHYDVTTKDNVTAEGDSFGKPMTEMSPGVDHKKETVIPEPDKLTYDQIKRFTEDLSTDRKLGIGQSDDSEHMTSSLHNEAVSRESPLRFPITDTEEYMDSPSHKPDTEWKVPDCGVEQKPGVDVPERDPFRGDQSKDATEELPIDREVGARYNETGKRGTSTESVDRDFQTQSPPPSPIKGADEGMYKPISEPDNFSSSLTPESLNAHLYGGVLGTEDRLTSKGKGNVFSSETNGNDFSFDTDLSHPEPQESQMDNRMTDNTPIDFTKEQDSNAANRSEDGKESSSEGWGKWSEDKLNQTVDAFASKLGAADSTDETLAHPTEHDEREIYKTKSGDYFDPTDTKNNAFEQQLTRLSSSNPDETDTLMYTALAGSSAIAETLHKLKDTVASTLGYGSVQQSDEDRSTDQPRSVTECEQVQGREEGVGNEQEDVPEEMNKTTAGSDADAVQTDHRIKNPDIAGSDSPLQDGKERDTNIEHQWSLNSASDVPQAAFL